MQCGSVLSVSMGAVSLSFHSFFQQGVKPLDICEGVVERHRCYPHQVGLPQITLQVEGKDEGEGLVELASSITVTPLWQRNWKISSIGHENCNDN